MLLRLLVWLNVLDTVLTVIVISLKWATETNPIMDYFLQQGPIIFGLGKLTLTIGGSLLLWKGRKHRWSLPGAAFCTLCYAAVVAYEMVMITAMVFGG
jgi:hypothetical protein